MQVIKEVTIKGRKADMWESRDAEGRKVYAVSFPLKDGTRVQPIVIFHRSQKAAIRDAHNLGVAW